MCVCVCVLINDGLWIESINQSDRRVVFCLLALGFVELLR